MKVALYRCLKQIIYSQKNPGNDWGIGRVEWLEVLLSGFGCVWKEAARNPVLAPGPWRPVVILLTSKDGGDAPRGATVRAHARPVARGASSPTHRCFSNRPTQRNLRHTNVMGACAICFSDESRSPEL